MFFTIMLVESVYNYVKSDIINGCCSISLPLMKPLMKAAITEIFMRGLRDLLSRQCSTGML